MSPAGGDGDGWVDLPDGRRFWGRHGAAGLLLVADGGVLLQHRAGFSHFGGTWGLPGGAIDSAETPAQGALREAAEEAGVRSSDVAVLATSELDLGLWRYTTVLARASTRLPVVIGDRESIELRWVDLDRATELPLHPGLADAWQVLVPAVRLDPLVVVDVANVLGSAPDGWWRDRAGATAALVDRIVATDLLPAATFGLPLTRWRVEFALVVEGSAATVPAPAPTAGRTLHRASGSGDDEIVRVVAEAVRAGRRPVVAVTADRALRARVEALGARTVGPLALRDALETV